MATILEGVVTIRMDVAPRIFLPIEGQGGVGLLGERLGDENTLLRSRGALLVLGGSSLFLGFIIPEELGSLFYASASVRKLPELTGGLDLMIAELLAHLDSPDVRSEKKQSPALA